MKKEQIEKIARSVAESFNIRPELVCGLIERESSWIDVPPRYEPKFYIDYVMHRTDLDDSEKSKRSSSWGLMQVMGETAREYGLHGDIEQLRDAEIGITYGCKLFKHLMKITDGDEARALLHYNGGGNLKYPDEVLQLAQKYVKEENINV